MKKKALYILLLIITILFTTTACEININNNECECEEKENIGKYKNDFIGVEFTKTYTINHIAESNDYEYIYITIRGFQEEEIETVKVKRSQFENAQVGDAYEITFQVKDNDIDNNIKSIFEHSTIVKTTKTDKTGLEQINENYYDHLEK